jgi:hypothetical protein
VPGTGRIVSVSRAKPAPPSGIVWSNSLETWAVALALFAIAAVDAYALSRRVLAPLEELGAAATAMGTLKAPAFAIASRPNCAISPPRRKRA